MAASRLRMIMIWKSPQSSADATGRPSGRRGIVPPTQETVMSGRFAFALVILALLATPQMPQPAQTPAAPQPTFRGGIELMTLDVVPRTDAGQFVADLRPEEFQVLEDGVAQQVASLVMVSGGRVFNLATPPAAPDP